MPCDFGADPDFRDLIHSFLARDGEAGNDGFDSATWERLREMGVTLLTTPESRGGSGASLAEGAELVYGLSRQGVAVPYAEHDLLASRLTELADLPAVDTVTGAAHSSAPVAPGQLLEVAGAAGLERLLVVSGDGEASFVQDLPAEAFALVSLDEHGVGTGGALRLLSAAPVIDLDPGIGREFRLRGALVRAVQIVGALDRCVAEAVGYAHVRTQFGRPLARFQAVQALLADAAAETAAAASATEAAVRAWTATAEATAEVERAVAVAKSFASHAVDTVTRNAHQVLGAMGTTIEHDLHRFSVPPLRWRHEFGSARSWDSWLAQSDRPDGLWAGVASV